MFVGMILDGEESDMATIKRSGFDATETFMSTRDAQAWRQMVETTLDPGEKISFDLAEYARGYSAEPCAGAAGRTRETSG